MILLNKDRQSHVRRCWALNLGVDIVPGLPRTELFGGVFAASITEIPRVTRAQRLKQRKVGRIVTTSRQVQPAQKCSQT